MTALVTAFVITVAATPLVRKIALRWKLGDKPNGRKIHPFMIPHVGGIAIVVGTLVGVFASGAAATESMGNWRSSFLGVLPPVSLIVVLGLVDDMKSLRVFQKLTIQIVVAVILAVSGFVLFTGVAALDTVDALVLLVSVMFFVGISSAVNLVDGHDGLAAGITLISAVAFAVMAVMLGAGSVVAATLALTGACLGFLVFNFPPAKIYMGDTGSMFLGIMLALVACTLTSAAPTARTFVAICFILGVPMLDAFLAIARRLLLRTPIFKADCLHMHHILSALSFSPKQTLVVMYSMQALLAALGLLVLNGHSFPIFIGLLFVAIVFVSYLRVMVVSQSEPAGAPNLASGSIPQIKEQRSSTEGVARAVGGQGR
ncbi:MAG: MraY family glycosyltransferase [Candidatus Latescibacterota bacterium]